jgi:non-specific serine/threonine protein kinase
VAPRRQQTLEATIDWSYRVLAEPERRVFERLSVFAGGISLEAAEAVCVSGQITPDSVLSTLAVLVDKSDVVADPALEPGPRFRLLEPIRQFARARLDGRHESSVRQRHAAFFLTLAEQTVQLARAEQPQCCYDRLLVEHSNVRLALLYFEAHDAERLLRLAAALWLFWFRFGFYHDGAAWLAKALAADVNGRPRERATAKCGLVELR